MSLNKNKSKLQINRIRIIKSFGVASFLFLLLSNVKDKVITVGTDYIVGYGWTTFVLKNSDLISPLAYTTTFTNAPSGEVVRVPEYLTSIFPRALHFAINYFFNTLDSLNILLILTLVPIIITLINLLSSKIGYLLSFLATFSIILSGSFFTKLLSHPTSLFGFYIIVSVFFYFQAIEKQSIKNLIMGMLFLNLVIYSDAYNFILVVITTGILTLMFLLSENRKLIKKYFLIYVGGVGLNYILLYSIIIFFNVEGDKYNRPFVETTYFGTKIASLVIPSLQYTFDESKTNFIGFASLSVLIIALIFCTLGLIKIIIISNFQKFLLSFSLVTLYFSLGTNENIFSINFLNNLFFDYFQQFRVSSRLFVYSLISGILFLLLSLNLSNRQKKFLSVMICVGLFIDLFKLKSVEDKLFDYTSLESEYKYLNDLGQDLTYAFIPDDDVNRSMLIDQIFLNAPIKNSNETNFKLTLISGMNQPISPCLASREKIDYVVARSNKEIINNINNQLWTLTSESELFGVNTSNVNKLFAAKPYSMIEFGNIDKINFQGVVKEGNLLNVGFRMIEVKANLELTYFVDNYMSESIILSIYPLKKDQNLKIFNNNNLIFNDSITESGQRVELKLLPKNKIIFQVENLLKPSEVYSDSADNRLLGPMIVFNSLSNC